MDDLATGTFVNWASRRIASIFTLRPEERSQRLYASIRRPQDRTLTSLKTFAEWCIRSWGIFKSMSRGWSPVFTRDIGSQEIYA